MVQDATSFCVLNVKVFYSFVLCCLRIIVSFKAIRQSWQIRFFPVKKITVFFFFTNFDPDTSLTLLYIYIYICLIYISPCNTPHLNFHSLRIIIRLYLRVRADGAPICTHCGRLGRVLIRAGLASKLWDSLLFFCRNGIRKARAVNHEMC